jgi:hypothetical protein
LSRFGQTVCRAPQASALADMFITSTYPHRLPLTRPYLSRTPEHPSVPTKRLVQYRTSPFHTSLACSSWQAPRPIGRALFCYLIPKRSMLLTTCTRVGDHLHVRGPFRTTRHPHRHHRIPLTMSSEYHDKFASRFTRSHRLLYASPYSSSHIVIANSDVASHVAAPACGRCCQRLPTFLGHSGPFQGASTYRRLLKSSISA